MKSKGIFGGVLVIFFILITSLLLLIPQLIYAGTPNVDGRYSNDKSNYTLVATASGGRGKLYYNRVGDVLYLLVTVNSDKVNDNVFGDSKLDKTYLEEVDWNNHNFKHLVQSEHIEIRVHDGSTSYTWLQDYIYGSFGSWDSGPSGPDGGGTPPPGLNCASSLEWNMKYSTWDITLGGTRTSDTEYKSPDPRNGYPNFDNTNKWEWLVIYEMSFDASVFGENTIYVEVISAHNSPSKDGDPDVPIIDELLCIIGDYVWEDTNHDGIQDGGESGISGVTVKLYKGDHTLAGTTTTNGSGEYSFTGLDPGDYYLEFILPSGYSFSPKDQGGNDSKDSDADPSTHKTAVTTLLSGEIDMTWDAGMYSGVNIDIDIEKHTNGYDADNPTGPTIPVGGTVTWEYIVTNICDVTLVNIVVTDDILGEIGTISSLAPGASQTLIATGIAEEGQYENNATVVGEYEGETVTDDDPSHYIGELTAEPSIDIEKHTNGHDADNPTGPEIPVEGEVLWEYIVTNTGNVTLTNIVVTDDILGVIGTITSLGPGDSETLKAKGTAEEGQYENNATVVGEYEGETVTDDDPSHYIGVLGAIGDFVWNDVNGNGIQDSLEVGIDSVVVNLYREGGSGIFASDMTDSSGYYFFGDLIPGNYILEFILPEGYTFSPQDQGTDDGKDSDANKTTGLTDVITVLGNVEDLTWDAGMFEYASISNYVWDDKNINGIQDDDEKGIDGILVLLYMDLDGDGIPEPKGTIPFAQFGLDEGAFLDIFPTTTGDDGYALGWYLTDENGFYIFDYLLPGPYFLIFQLKLGYLFSPAGTTNDAKDSDADPNTGVTDVTVLDPGENDPDWDAGVYKYWDKPGKGRKWILARHQPWYGDAENDSTLRHWIESYFGGYADTALLNTYDTYKDPKVWEKQICLAWACGIDGFAVDWYGKDSYENPGINGLLDKADSLYNLYYSKGFNFEIAVSYNEMAYGRLDSNFIYVGDSLITHPAYWGTRRNVRHPVFVYNVEDTTIYTPGEYRACADTTLPQDIILLWNGTQIEVFDPFDVCYGWVQPKIGEWIPGSSQWDDLYGLEWGHDYLDSTYWRINYLPHKGDLMFAIGVTWPGYNDKSYFKGLNHWMDRQDTLVYELTWEKVHNYHYALPMPWCYIETWNDFNHATEIEPSIEWYYNFIVLTRDHARRFKSSLPPDSVGVENLGLLVPQHVYQARVASELRPGEASDIVKLLEKALDNFFDRNHLKALSLADSAAGIAPKPFSIDAITDSTVEVYWRSARHANSYNVYYSPDASCFEPCAFCRPNVISIGDVNQITITGLKPNTTYTIAVTAVDTSLGPYANESWYENTFTGAKIKSFTTTGVSSVSDMNDMIPDKFALSQNYPNPFNPGTMIQYQLPEPGHVKLSIYNLLGQEIRTLINDNKRPGYYQIQWDAKDKFGKSVGSGIYVYRLVVDSKKEKFVSIRKMTVLQ